MTRSVPVNVGIAITVLLSLVAAGGAPAHATSVALASDGLVVGGQHDTATEFQTAAVLHNASVFGSGEAAYVARGSSNVTEATQQTSKMGSVGSDGSGYFAQSFTADKGKITTLGVWLDEYNSEGQVRLALAPGDGNGNPDETTILWNSALINTDTLGQWYKINTGGVNVTKGQTYYLLIDGYQNDGATGSAYAGLSDTYTDTGENFIYSNDGGSSWTSANSPMAVTIRYRYQLPLPMQYVSGNLTVDSAAQASLNLTQLTNVSADVRLEYWSGDRWTLANQTTFTTPGNHTITLPEVSSSTWRTNITVSKTGSNPEFRLSDESILFNPHAPQASNIQPVDGANLTSKDVEFSIDVADADFPTAQGDTVTATLYVDGSQAFQTTVTSNQTITTTETLEGGGGHDYYWTLEDSWGQSTTTATRTLYSPSQLVIYKERNATVRVTTDGNASVTVYATDNVYERQVTNGTVDLTGLPVDEPLYVRAQIPGYYPRTVLIQSLYQQQRLYVLSENASAVQNRFTLEEVPGYPEDTTMLQIQRPLTINNSTTWKTIVGAEFGVSGVSVYLQEGIRYRLKIIGPDGNVASLGGYVAAVAETVPLAPAQPTIESHPEDIPIAYGATREAQTLVLGFEDNTGNISSVTAVIHKRGNESYLLQPNTTFENTASIAYSVQLSNASANQTWVVEYHANFNDGSTRVFEAIAGAGGEDTVPIELGQMWKQIIVSALLILFAAAFSLYNRSEGALAVALMGGLLYYIGWLGAITTAPAISVAIGIGVFSLLNNRT